MCGSAARVAHGRAGDRCRSSNGERARRPGRGGRSTFNWENDTGDVCSIRAREKECCSSDVVGRGRTVERQSHSKGRPEDRVVEAFLRKLRCREGGGDRVDANALAPEVKRYVLHESVDRTLRGVVPDLPSVAAEPRRRGDGSKRTTRHTKRRYDSPSEVDHAVDVDGVHPLPRLVGELVDRSRL